MKRLSDLTRVLVQLENGLKDLYGERFRDLLLYGSYARGDAREGSDIDLVLLLDGPVDTVQEMLRLEPVAWPLSLENDIVLSVFPVSFQAYESGETSFLRTVRREAIRAA